MSIVEDLLNNISENVTAKGLVNSQASKLMMGIEGLDDIALPILQEEQKNLVDVVTDSVAMIDANNGELDRMLLTPEQLAVGKEAIKLALDTNLATMASQNIEVVIDNLDKNIVVLEPVGHMVDDGVNPKNVFGDTLSLESWDGQDVSRVTAQHVTTNILASKQSPIGELFYPTVVVPTRQMGVSISINIDSIQEPFRRKITGEVDKLNKTSLIKATNNFDKFLVDKTKVIPVLRMGQNDSKLLVDQSYINNDTGVEITTAPIRTDKEISLLGISQTDESIAQGVMNQTDALDGTIHTKRLYYNMESTDGATVETFMFKLPDGKWTQTLTGHSKDLEWNYDNNGLIINTSKTTLAKGGASTLLDGLPSNYEARIRIKLNGSGNTESATFMVNTNIVEFTLQELRDGNGDLVATDAQEYVDIKAVIDTLKVVGYELDAYTTNSNQRNIGQLIVRDRYTYVYGLNFRSPITVPTPPTNALGEDNGVGIVLTQVAMLGVRTSASAIMALDEHASLLKSYKTVSSNEATDNRLGVGGRLFNTYYNEPIIDLETIVDSQKSGERADDIKAAIHAQIWDELSNMIVQSNYKTVIGIQNGGVVGKIDVLFAVPSRFYKYVKDLDFGSEYNVRVATTMYKGENDILGDRIFMTLGYGDNKGIGANPYRFGCMGWSPEYTVDTVLRTEGGAERRKTIVPRFGHFSLLNILSVFNVTNLDSVLKKVTLNTKEQA